MSENENLLLRLRQGVDGYSRTQQKLGEFVLSDPAKVVYLTIPNWRVKATPARRASHVCAARLGVRVITNSKWRWLSISSKDSR